MQCWATQPNFGWMDEVSLSQNCSIWVSLLCVLCWDGDPLRGVVWGGIRLERERFRSMQCSKAAMSCHWPLPGAGRAPGSLVKIISRGCLPVFFHSISFDLKSPNWIRIDWPAGWMRADHTDREGKHRHNSGWRKHPEPKLKFNNWKINEWLVRNETFSISFLGKRDWYCGGYEKPNKEADKQLVKKEKVTIIRIMLLLLLMMMMSRCKKREQDKPLCRVSPLSDTSVTIEWHGNGEIL